MNLFLFTSPMWPHVATMSTIILLVISPRPPPRKLRLTGMAEALTSAKRGRQRWPGVVANEVEKASACDSGSRTRRGELKLLVSHCNLSMHWATSCGFCGPRTVPGRSVFACNRGLCNSGRLGLPSRCGRGPSAVRFGCGLRRSALCVPICLAHSFAARPWRILSIS